MELQTEIFEHLETVSNWGGAAHFPGYVYRPSRVRDLDAILELSQQTGKSVAFRGGGNSYGDAFSNTEEIVLDMSRLNRILDWNPETGVIKCEPGVTVDQLWRYILPDGWWPPIVTGTAKTTLGGCAAMNTHGKNGWQMGTFGDHVLRFEILTGSGKRITCSPTQNKTLFFSAIGGMGMLGCFLSITLQMKRIYSGKLSVESVTRPDLAGSLRYIDDHKESSDYVVGWIDSFARGKRLGRGVLHRADYLRPDEDRHALQTLLPEAQAISDSVLGLIPKSSMWFWMRPFVNRVGMRLVNQARYSAGRLHAGESGEHFMQSHAGFHFLLDYIPNWKWAYGSGGLIQYQCFLPESTAEHGFREIFELCQNRRLQNYLSVLKRHRPDKFLISYGLNGYSMAMDFKITERNRAQIVQLSHALDEIVLQNGGRFYFAKDSTLRPEVARAYLGEKGVHRLHALKAKYDPNNRFQSNMWRRVFECR